MALAHVRLKEIGYIADSAASVYANPTGKTTYVKLIVVHNNAKTAKYVQLYNVPDSGGSAGTAAAANRFFSADIPAYDTVIIELPGPGLILTDKNDTIQAETETASSVTIQITGAQE